MLVFVHDRIAWVDLFVQKQIRSQDDESRQTALDSTDWEHKQTCAWRQQRDGDANHCVSSHQKRENGLNSGVLSGKTCRKNQRRAVNTAPSIHRSSNVGETVLKCLVTDMFHDHCMQQQGGQVQLIYHSGPMQFVRLRR